ncbi:hypothetical protein NUW58_g3537 [Xylaria curta]|uniref:Uncharacterized protein n=1 Tax=Xylaria curta TaxID=42375 RepID=A0ACC1PAJ8_9PEZI|nr:hypothetical protein NUW58_g3537 [Xylaria curta]
MASRIDRSFFDKTLRDFKEGLRRREIEDFKTTTLKELKTSIAELQAKQHAQRRIQDLNRLQPFIEAIEQYGEVVGIFYNNNDIVAFVWGPTKFLLRTTSVADDAFHELLDAYEHMGESLPLLRPYQGLFRTEPRMVRVLSHMYDDILTFQRIVLRYFQQPQWQQLFSESWDACKSRFSSIILNTARHRSLIESQASPSQIEESQENSHQSRRIEDDQLDELDLQRVRDVLNWLRAYNAEIDQDAHAKARAEYPQTGRWLLETTFFQEWFDPRFPTIPPLLWLNGIPGAGKTILASLVVEEARKLNPTPMVLFFYCRHENSERDNFVALGRSLLAQFLKQDHGLLPTLYQKSCQSGEAMLTSPALVEELLSLAFANCRSAYVILDGVDECPRDERKYIAQWFRKIVENLPNNEPDKIRCLFISQDDGYARKDFVGLASIKITVDDNRHDINEYSRIEANKLRENCPLLTEEKASILEEELKPGIFPKEINEAYRRIMVRMSEHAPQEAIEDTSKLLGWLVCAKRPLKWHEIQAMNSINLDEQRVTLESHSFIKSPKYLCASLVETRLDGTLEFVHLTAKFFLLEENHVNASAEEIKIATLCIDYLNLPSCVYPATAEHVLNGDYGFLDYAVIYWLQHLEAGIALKTHEDEQLMAQLAESLEVFITQHWASPSATLALAKRQSEKFQFFKELRFYDQLEKVVASTRRQLKFFGQMKKEEIALNLVNIIDNVRKILEDIISGTMDPLVQKTVNERYGSNLYKCHRFSCQFFTTGFSSADERDKHTSKHERPFRCSEEKCAGYMFGFASAAEREKHVRETHFTGTIQDEEFPTDQDVAHSIEDNHPTVDQDPAAEPSGQDGSIGIPVIVTIEQSESESEPQTEYHQQKRRQQTEFKCPHCPMIYKKRFNLQSHLRTHDSERPHVCQFCSKGFARLSDYTRHLDTHTGTKNFVCRGELMNGGIWGCGRSFSRADTLRKHHESKVGKACIQPLQQQQRKD